MPSRAEPQERLWKGRSLRNVFHGFAMDFLPSVDLWRWYLFAMLFIIIIIITISIATATKILPLCAEWVQGKLRTMSRPNSLEVV